MDKLKVRLSGVLILFFSTSLLFSQNYMEQSFLQTMVQVEKSPAGTTFVKHILGEGQSLYSISQFYDAALYDIKRFNPNLVVGNEFTGMQINVPIDDKHLIKELNQAGNYQLLEQIYYQVKKEDTVYGIAKRKFDLSVETLLNRNGVTAEQVKQGQFLFIGWIPSVGLNHYGKPVKEKKVFYSTENEPFRTEFVEKGGSAKRFVEERGAAFWDKNAGDDYDFYVMHRKAPKNTIIEITNPDTGRKIYTKVLAKIPPKYPNKVKIVVSPKVAKYLGAVNANFFVSLGYYK